MRKTNASQVKVDRKPEPAFAAPPKTETLKKEVSLPIRDEAKAVFSKTSRVETASQQIYTSETVSKPEAKSAPQQIIQEPTRKPPSQDVPKVVSDRKVEPKPTKSGEAEQAKKQEPPKMKPSEPAPVTYKKEAYPQKGIQIIKLCKTHTALKIPRIYWDKQYNLLFFLCLCSSLVLT